MLFLRTYQQQTDWHKEVRKIKWDTLPKDAATPMTDGILAKPIFLDCSPLQWKEASSRCTLAHCQVGRGTRYWGCCLSMDTAVSPYYGDLTPHQFHGSSLRTYTNKVLLRQQCVVPHVRPFRPPDHVPPPDDLPDKEKLRWPRPLRTFARLFGLDGLRPKELRQCRQGSAFMFQAFMACTWHLVLGGLFLSEHPAPPDDTDKASVWTSAYILLLKKSSWYCPENLWPMEMGSACAEAYRALQFALTTPGALYVCLCR